MKTDKYSFYSKSEYLNLKILMSFHIKSRDNFVVRVLGIVPLLVQLLGVVPMLVQTFDTVPMLVQILGIVPMLVKIVGVIPMLVQTFVTVTMVLKVLGIVPILTQILGAVPIRGDQKNQKFPSQLALELSHSLSLTVSPQK